MVVKGRKFWGRQQRSFTQPGEHRAKTSTSKLGPQTRLQEWSRPGCPTPQNLCLKEKIQTAWLPSFSFSLQAAPPRPTNRYSKPHTERAAPRCLFSHHTELWEKVPGHLLFFAQTAETRRHRSTAADLGRQSLVCLFQPRPPRSRPSIFSSADLQSLTFPGRRPHGRRYESALWLLGRARCNSAAGSCAMVVQPLVGLDWGRHG